MDPEYVTRDAPTGDDAYVIRIEDAEGRRLKVRVSKTEAAEGLVPATTTARVLRKKVDALITQFLVSTDRLPENEAHIWRRGDSGELERVE